eukprot:jgi/Mesvir1/19468/Mv10493-RA.1
MSVSSGFSPAELERLLQAIAVAHNPLVPADQRRAATEYCEQFKAWEPERVAQISFELLRPESQNTEEVQHFALGVLQHVARCGRLPPSARPMLAEGSLRLFQQHCASCDAAPCSYALKGKVSGLLAEVVRQEGAPAVQQVLPPLLELARGGAGAAELVSLVLHWLPEDVTVHTEGLEGDHRRQLLQALTAALPQILPTLYQLLDAHFVAAMSAATSGDKAKACRHVAAVQAALGAAAAYAEWAPVTLVHSSGLINACGYLLSSKELRMPACEVLRLLACRKRVKEDRAPSSFDTAMVLLFEIFSAVAEAALRNITPAVSAAVAAEAGVAACVDDEGEREVDGEDEDFLERCCDAMAALGASHLALLKDPGKEACYLRQMLAFARHPNKLVSAASLGVWLPLLRERAPHTAGSSPTQPPIQATAGGSPALVTPLPAIPLEYLRDLMQTAAAQLHKGMGFGRDDEFPAEFTAELDFHTYRAQMLELIRHVAAFQPLMAVDVAVQHVSRAVQLAERNIMSSPPANGGGGPEPPLVARTYTAVDDAAQLLDLVAGALPAEFFRDNSSTQASLGGAGGASGGGVVVGVASLWSREQVARVQNEIDTTVASLLQLRWESRPLLVLHLAHMLGGGGLVRYFDKAPRTLPTFLDVFFGLLSTLPPATVSSGAVAASERAARKLVQQARTAVCSALQNVCGGAAPALVPQLPTMGAAVDRLWRQGVLRDGEKTVLHFALLAVNAASGSEERQLETLDWIMGPVREQLASPAFQSILADPRLFVQQFFVGTPSGAAATPGAPPPLCSGPARSLLYFALATAEKVLKSVCAPPGKGGPGPLPLTWPKPAHAAWFWGNVAWLLPSLTKLTRCLHALWVPSVRAHIPAELASALDVSAHDAALLLGRGIVAARAAEGGDGDGERRMDAEGVNPLRNWLKLLREGLYQLIGVLAARAPGFYDHPAARAAAPSLHGALLEHLGDMEDRHLRALVRVVVHPIVRHCPAGAARDVWVAPLLPPLVTQMQARLPAKWARVAAEGSTLAAGVEGARGDSTRVAGGGAEGREVVAEKLLRDLTREVAGLLYFMAYPEGGPTGVAAATANGVGAHDTTMGAAEDAASTSGSTPGVPPPASTPPPPSDDLLLYLLAMPMAGVASVQLALEAIGWPDSESANKCAAVCAAVLLRVPRAPTLLSVVSPMLTAAIQGLTLESNASNQADLMALIRNIYMGHRDIAHQVLLPLVSMDLAAVKALDERLRATGSEKEQRAILKKLLLEAGGRQLKAIAAPQKLAAISNLNDPSMKERRRRAASTSVDNGAPETNYLEAILS